MRVGSLNDLSVPNNLLKRTLRRTRIPVRIGPFRTPWDVAHDAQAVKGDKTGWFGVNPHGQFSQLRRNRDTAMRIEPLSPHRTREHICTLKHPARRRPNGLSAQVVQQALGEGRGLIRKNYGMVADATQRWPKRHGLCLCPCPLAQASVAAFVDQFSQADPSVQRMTRATAPNPARKRTRQTWGVQHFWMHKACDLLTPSTRFKAHRELTA